jgi:hypothetical protein
MSNKSKWRTLLYRRGDTPPMKPKVASAKPTKTKKRDTGLRSKLKLPGGDKPYGIPGVHPNVPRYDGAGKFRLKFTQQLAKYPPSQRGTQERARRRTRGA